MVKRFQNIILGRNVLKNKPLCIFLPKISAYRTDFDETKYIYIYIYIYIYKCILIKDDLLKKYNEVWQKLKAVSKSNLIVNLCTMKNV